MRMFMNTFDLSEDARTHVKSTDEYKYDKNHFIGSQGALTYRYRKEDLFNTGILVVVARPGKNGELIPIINKQFVITYAQKILHKKSVAYEEPIMFSYGQNIDDNHVVTMDASSALTDCKHYPKKCRSISFVNLAIASCQVNIDSISKLTTKNIRLCDVSVAKTGDPICLAGYPYEYRGALYYMQGSIKEIVTWKGETIFLFDNIETSEGQEGSPVYWKPKEGGEWSIIGIYCNYDYDTKECYAVGFSKSKIKWLRKTAKKVLNIAKSKDFVFYAVQPEMPLQNDNKKEQNNIENLNEPGKQSSDEHQKIKTTEILNEPQMHQKNTEDKSDPEKHLNDEHDDSQKSKGKQNESKNKLKGNNTFSQQIIKDENTHLLVIQKESNNHKANLNLQLSFTVSD